MYIVLKQPYNRLLEVSNFRSYRYGKEAFINIRAEFNSRTTCDSLDLLENKCTRVLFFFCSTLPSRTPNTAYPIYERDVQSQDWMQC